MFFHVRLHCEAELLVYKILYISVRALIESAGCVLAYLPTYSPDLNAIEEAISKMKEGLRRLKPRDETSLEAGLVQVFNSVSVSDVLAWVAHAGYELIL